MKIVGNLANFLVHMPRELKTLCKSVYWFLYDMDIRHERVNCCLVKFLRQVKKMDVRLCTAICKNVEHNELHPEKRKIKINLPIAHWRLVKYAKANKY